MAPDVRCVCVLAVWIVFASSVQSLRIGEPLLVGLEITAEIFKNSNDVYPTDVYVAMDTKGMENTHIELHLKRSAYSSASQRCVSFTVVNTTSSLCVLKQGDRRYTLIGYFCKDGLNIAVKPDTRATHINKNQKEANHVLVAESTCKQKSSNEKAKENEDDMILSNKWDDFSESANQRPSVAMAKRRKRSETVYTVELLMVVDYAAYSWWLSLQRRGPNRQSSAMDAIRQYYSYIFTGIADRFKGIKQLPYSIDLAFVDIIVAKTKAKSQWTETSLLENDVESTRVMVNSSEALDKFQKWLDESQDLPKYDHAVLFTGTNLSYAGSPGNTGLAFAASMCRNISNSSIVEDAFDFRSVLYATQQISRSLGASDDMDNNDCLEFFNYVMAPKLKMPIKSFTANRWTFSSCSEVYFTEYIEDMNVQGINCLAEHSFIDQVPIFVTEFVQTLPGKVYDAKQQCKHKFGSRSDICREEISKYNDICAGLLCTIPGRGGCGYILPADGTPCGNKKYCLTGKCSTFEDADVRSDVCVFGNQPKMKCNRRVFRKPHLCYDDKLKNKCCQSCDRVRINGIVDCEFGDRSKDCTLRGCTQNDNTYVTKTCCLTCADGPTPFAPPLDFDFSTSPPTESTTLTDIFLTSPANTGLTSLDSGSTIPLGTKVSNSATATTLDSLSTIGISMGSTNADTSNQPATNTFPTSSPSASSVSGNQIDPVSTDVSSMTSYFDTTTTSPFGSSYDPYIYASDPDTPPYAYFTSTQSNTQGQTEGTNRFETPAKKVTSTPRSGCKGATGARAAGTKAPEYSTHRPYRGDVFHSADRRFFHDLALLMRKEQSHVKEDMHRAFKRLYRYVSHQIRMSQDSDLEPLSFADPLPPHSESPSNDDDDLNRSLHPVWRHQYVDVMRRLKTSVKHFRYKVLAAVRRFLFEN